MQQSEILVLLTVFTGLVAAAFVILSIAGIGIHRSMRRISAKVDSLSADLKKSADLVAAHASSLLDTVKGATERLRTLQDNLTATSAIVQNRVIEVDSFLAETSDAARLQIARIQDVVDTASRSVEETFETLHRGVIAPINEISAIVAGIRVGLDVLLRRRKGPAKPSDRDGELFI